MFVKLNGEAGLDETKRSVDRGGDVKLDELGRIFGDRRMATTTEKGQVCSGQFPWWHLNVMGVAVL